MQLKWQLFCKLTLLYCYLTATEEEEHQSFSLADKVTLYKGDITILEVDAIVNAGEFADSDQFSQFYYISKAVSAQLLH